MPITYNSLGDIIVAHLNQYSLVQIVGIANANFRDLRAFIFVVTMNDMNDEW